MSEKLKYNLVPLAEIKEQIKKVDMLFQIKCYDLSWSESMKVLKEVVCYPFPVFPYRIMITKGWDGILEEKDKLNSKEHEKASFVLEKLILIVEANSSFQDGVKVTPEHNDVILNLLKSLFKKLLMLIKEMGKIPKSVGIVMKKSVNNQPDTQEYDEDESDFGLESNQEIPETKLVSEKIGFELLYFDEIRGPLPYLKLGNELEKETYESVKNLMDQKEGTITLIMNGWVLINHIAEFRFASENKPLILIHLLLYWNDQEFPHLYERISTIESELQDLTNTLIEIPEFEKIFLGNQGGNEEKMLNAKIIPFLNKLNGNKLDQIEKGKSNTKKIGGNGSEGHKYEKEIYDLEKIIKDNDYSDDQKVLLRVLNVVFTNQSN